MNWNEWEFVWKRQDLPVGAGADVAKLMETFEAAHRRMARVLLVRDLTEASAGVLVSGVFAFTAWRMGRAGWPIAIAVALCLGVTGVFLWERVKGRPPGPFPEPRSSRRSRPTCRTGVPVEPAHSGDGGTWRPSSSPA